MHRISGLLQAGDFGVAREQLQAVVDQYPSFAEAQRLLAGTLLALGEVPAAESLLRHALMLDPQWTPTLATLGELLLSSGRGTEAEPLLQHAVSGSPPAPRAALVLARWYNDLQRPAEALAVAGAYCGAGHLDPELVTQYVAALGALGRQDEAVAAYRKLAASTPASSAVAHALAIALGAAGQHGEAGRLAQQSLVLGARTPAAYTTLARSLIATGEFERAEAALRDGLRLDPRQPEAHDSLARLVWMRSGDSAQATASLDEALQRFPHEDALWAARAAILQGAGQPRAAWACLSERAARPQAPPALLLRAGLAALEFAPADALTLAGRVLTMLPVNPAARTMKAAAQLGTGAAQEALSGCDALLAETPDDQYLIALQCTAWRLLGDARYEEICDYPQLVRPQQLEAPAGWSDRAGFLADVRTSLGRLHDAQRYPLLFQSLRHGTETTGDLTRSDEPPIRALFQAFEAPIREYLRLIGAGPDPLRRRNHGAWRYNGSWSVRLRSAGFHTSHVHPRGWISSACYIDLPPDMGNAEDRDGWLSFGQPSLITTPTLLPEHALRPAAGTLVLFPSYFWHGTVPFVSALTRLTVAFDIVPAG